MKGFVLGAVCVFYLSHVSCTPTGQHTVKKRVGNLPIIPGDNDEEGLTSLKQKKWRLEPVEVKQIEAYGPKGKVEKPSKEDSRPKRFGGRSYSAMERLSNEYSNLNGNININTNHHQKVKENGELVSSFHRAGEKQVSPGHQPHTQELTEVDLPALKVHEKVLQNDGHIYHLPNDNYQEADSVDDEAEVLREASDLAAYIETTGDSLGGLNFIRDLIKEGKMTEEEGAVFIQLVNAFLDTDEQAIKEKEDEAERERESAAENILNFSDYLDKEYERGAISQREYEQLKDKLMESVLERVGEDPQFLAEPNPY